MGLVKKHQVDVAGIAMCPPLRSVSTKTLSGECDEKSGSTTPTTKEFKLSCPPPPRKRRPVSKCRKNGDIEFFTSPELDSFFDYFANAETRKCRS